MRQRQIDICHGLLVITWVLTFIAMISLAKCGVHASPDDNLSTRAEIHINRAFESPGTGLKAVYLTTPGGRISLMGDGDAALMSWLVRNDGVQVVVTIVKETR